MDNKIVIYLGIAAVAYYLYTKTQEFEFTEDEKKAINNLVRGNTLRVLWAAGSILTKERQALLDKWVAKNPNKIPSIKPTTI
jgi:hypothetical protein